MPKRLREQEKAKASMLPIPKQICFAIFSLIEFPLKAQIFADFFSKIQISYFRWLGFNDESAVVIILFFGIHKAEGMVQTAISPRLTRTIYAFLLTDSNSTDVIRLASNGFVGGFANSPIVSIDIGCSPINIQGYMNQVAKLPNIVLF